jgi:hypothetical protein
LRITEVVSQTQKPQIHLNAYFGEIEIDKKEETKERR